MFCFTLKQKDYLIDKLVVEMGNLQIPQASLSLLAVSRQDVLLQQQVHLTGQRTGNYNY